MARPIVLRFPAQCFDCGAQLAAGSVARWFGRGRVSCCGAPMPSSSAPSSSPTTPPTRLAPTPPAPSSPTTPPAPSPASSFASDADAVVRAAGDSPRVRELIGKAAAGLTASELAELSSSGSAHKLVVRLKSGARLAVHAYDAHHVVRCIEESCLDRVRDVLSAAD